MGNKYVTLASLTAAAVFLITSCSVPPTVPGDKEMDLLALGVNEPLAGFDKMIPYTENLMRQDLGEVRYRAVVFSGSCNTVGQLKGQLIFIFLGTRSALLQQKFIRGVAVIDTIKNVGNISYTDETDHYPVTESGRLPTQKEIQRVFQALQAELTTKNAMDCNLVVSQIGSKWDARCGHLDDFVQTCAYEVSLDGVVTKKVLK